MSSRKNVQTPLTKFFKLFKAYVGFFGHEKLLKHLISLHFHQMIFNTYVLSYFNYRFTNRSSGICLQATIKYQLNDVFFIVFLFWVWYTVREINVYKKIYVIQLCYDIYK